MTATATILEGMLLAFEEGRLHALAELRHGSHDQSDHGNWSSKPDVVKSDNPLRANVEGVAPADERQERLAESLDSGVTERSPTFGGVQGNSIVELADGSKALFRRYGGPDQDELDAAVAKDFASKEWASFEVAKTLGFDDLMPAADLYDAGAGVTDAGGETIGFGSVQEFDTEVADAFEGQMKYARMFQQDRNAELRDVKGAARIAIFDYLTDNVDRHHLNYAITEDEDGTKRAIAIDHSSTFLQGKRGAAKSHFVAAFMETSEQEGVDLSEDFDFDALIEKVESSDMLTNLRMIDDAFAGDSYFDWAELMRLRAEALKEHGRIPNPADWPTMEDV